MFVKGENSLQYFLNFLAELKQRLVDKINEMVANDSIKLYMLSPQYQKDIKNQSLFNKGSTYFFRKQFPVSEKLISEIDIHIMKKAKVLPGRQVFAIRTFWKIFSNKVNY